MLSIVIQAGGLSRRMGQNKALMPFQGKPLIQRVLERVRSAGDEVLLTTNQPEAFAFLQIPMFPDVIPGKGALGGMLTAFSSATQPFVAVVACDLPFANADLISFEKGLLLKNGENLAVIPSSKLGLEPMHAVYRRAECLDSVRGALEQGEMKVTSWLAGIPKQVLGEEEIQAFNRSGSTFFNLNTPEEFKKAEELALILGLE